MVWSAAMTAKATEGAGVGGARVWAARPGGGWNSLPFLNPGAAT